MDRDNCRTQESLVPSHLREHTSSLGATHDGDACIGPHEQEARAKCAPAHAIVARAEAAAQDDSNFRHLQVSWKA